MSQINEKIIQILEGIKPLIRQKIDDVRSGNIALDPSIKEDESPVTIMDNYISDLFIQKFSKEFPEYNFLSEERLSDLVFPIFILDPVDGTKELLAGRPEWVVSFGLYFSSKLDDERSFSWIYNPVTEMEVSSESIVKKESKVSLDRDEVLVSRTEYEAGEHSRSEEKVRALGSIAYKLALLSMGQIKAVHSARDKNIWDIMAGTHLCWKKGIVGSNSTGALQELNKKLIEGPIKWQRVQK